MVSDQTSSLELLVRLGFDRILTSGGKPDVLQGAAVITELVEQVPLIFNSLKVTSESIK